MNTFKLLKNTVLGFCLVSGLTACAQTPRHNTSQSSHQASCSLPQHKKLTVAVDNAQASLSDRSCHYQFDAIHAQLLNIAVNDPSSTHNTEFRSFYKWSIDQGIISSLQGKEYYTRYFTNSFGNVLANDRNVCSSAANKEKLIKSIDRELGSKKIGLQDIMQDRKAYFSAQQTHNDLVFLIETTLLACEKT